MIRDNIPCVVTACCILHNMCEVHGDCFNDLWMEDVDVSSQPAVSFSADNNAHPTVKAIREMHL